MPLTQVKTSNLDTTNSLFFRNRIINGDMRIDQRNAGASVSLTGVTGFVVDRWNTVVRPTGGGTITGQQISDAPAGFSNSTRLTVNTADSSLAALDYYFHWQKIEGFNTYDLAFGTASAKTVTLSFWVKSNITGQFSAFLTNSSEVYSQPSAYTVNAVNTWEFKTLTFTGATAGTWIGATNGTGLIVGFGLANGTSLQGTSGVWTANSVYGSTGDVNWMATSGNTWQVTGVQLEVGTAATAFERRPYGTELQLCQRYYELTGFGNIAIFESGSTYVMNLVYKVTKRAQPSIGLYTTSNIRIRQFGTSDRDAASPGVGSTAGSSNGGYIKINGFGSVGATSSVAGIGFTTSSENGDLFSISAEL
jgi:hypothetical protein